MILDVGCGDQPRGDVNCDLLVPDSLRGWDLNPQGIQNFVRADVRALPFKTGAFDVVHCAHVIEHLNDEWEGINELKRVSRKYVAVIVPYSLFRIFDPLYHGLKYGAWLRWEKKNHLHFWMRDPFKQGKGSWRFRWLWQKKKRSEWFIRKNKLKAVMIFCPVPFETYTLFEVDHHD